MAPAPIPFSIDTVFAALRIVPFSTPFLVLLPALALYLARHQDAAGLTPLPGVGEWRTLLFTTYPWAGWLMLLILVRVLNRFLSVRAANHGVAKPDPADWKHDVVVITGGSLGIGKEIVELLSTKYKARIAVLDIAPPAYAKAADGSPPILWIKTDVTDRASIARARTAIEHEFGVPPSLVVSCAGITAGGPLLTLSANAVLKTMNINAIAHIHMAQEFVPYMVKNNHGHFVTVASSAAYFTMPNMSAYAMSKAAALAFHEALRAELRVLYKAPRVRTTVVTPTKVETLLGSSLNDADNAFLVPTLQPIQVATAIVDALNDGYSRAISQPQLTKVLPYLRAFPDWFRTLMEYLGGTDRGVTQESISASLRNGYGKAWSPEDYEAILGEVAATSARPAP